MGWLWRMFLKKMAGLSGGNGVPDSKKAYDRRKRKRQIKQ